MKRSLPSSSSSRPGPPSAFLPGSGGFRAPGSASIPKLYRPRIGILRQPRARDVAVRPRMAPPSMPSSLPPQVSTRRVGSSAPTSVVVGASSVRMRLTSVSGAPAVVKPKPAPVVNFIVVESEDPTSQPLLVYFQCYNFQFQDKSQEILLKVLEQQLKLKGYFDPEESNELNVKRVVDRKKFDRLLSNGVTLKCWRFNVSAVACNIFIKQFDPDGKDEIRDKETPQVGDDDSPEVIDLSSSNDSDSEEEVKVVKAKKMRATSDPSSVSNVQKEVPAGAKKLITTCSTMASPKVTDQDVSSKTVYVQKFQPQKTITPARKSLRCLYKADGGGASVKKEDKDKASKHPFISDCFVLLERLPTKVVPHTKGKIRTYTSKQQQQAEQAKGRGRPRKSVAPDRVTYASSSVPASVLSATEKSSVPDTIFSKAVATLSESASFSNKRIIQVLSSASSSDNSSDESSSSGDDSSESSESSASSMDLVEDFKKHLRRRAATSASSTTTTRKKPPPPPPRHFATVTPSQKALRKSSAGAFYFSIKAKLSPSEYHKNEDLFQNWEKFVRAESEVSHYYKSTILKVGDPKLVIYHLEMEQTKDGSSDLCLGVEKTVEMRCSGTIKITMKSEDVTLLFLQYVPSIDTNTQLNAILFNLMNSNICPGSKGFSQVDLCPGGILRDNVWFARGCKRVVFHIPNQKAMSFLEKQTQQCKACKELREKLLTYSKPLVPAQPTVPQKRKKKKIIYGTYTPPAVKTQYKVRESLDTLFKGFWKELGLTQQDFPPSKKGMAVSVVTETDFPVKEEKDSTNEKTVAVEKTIPKVEVMATGATVSTTAQSTPPSLPSTIPVLDNIEFQDNGQTLLMFSEIPLNPYDSKENFHFIENPDTDELNISWENLLSEIDPAGTDDVFKSLEGSVGQQQEQVNSFREESEGLYELGQLQDVFNTSFDQESSSSSLMFPTFSLTDL